MTEAPSHWIVVPCFNEAGRLPSEVFRQWLPAHPDFAILFVNDGSTDDTGGILGDLALALGRQGAVLELPENVGKAEAVRQGLQLALARHPQTIGYLDADLATPLDELPRLLEAMLATGSDMAIGSRVQLLGRDIRRRPRRHYLGRIFATAASVTLGLAVYDTQCGAKLIRVDEWTGRLLEQPFVSRWIFDVELIGRYLREVRNAPRWPTGPCGIVEVPLMRWHDVGNSKVRAGDFLKAGLELMAISRAHLRRGANDV